MSVTFLLSTASTRGKMKKPRAKLARGFFQPVRSCLAVFYVEQVALNRHVYVQKYKEQPNRKHKVARSPPPGQEKPLFDLPARKPRHFAFGKGWFRRVGGVMMFP